MKKLFLAILFVMLSMSSYASNSYWVDGRYTEIKTPDEYFYTTYANFLKKGISPDISRQLANDATQYYISSKLPSPQKIYKSAYDSNIIDGYSPEEAQRRAYSTAMQYAVEYGFE